MNGGAGYFGMFVFMAFFIIQTCRADSCRRRSEEIRSVLNELIDKLREDPRVEQLSDEYVKQLIGTRLTNTLPPPKPNNRGDQG